MYIKTRFKIPAEEDDHNFEKEFPLQWFTKKYLKEFTPRMPVYKIEKCHCLEKGSCKILYVSESFSRWLLKNKVNVK